MNHLTPNQFGWIIIIGALIVYFIPAIIANGREHRQKMAITALNILLGWTFIGWVVAIIWSLTYTPPTALQLQRETLQREKEIGQEIRYRQFTSQNPVLSGFLGVCGLIVMVGFWGSIIYYFIHK